MIKLEDLRKDAQVRGLEGDKLVRIVVTEPVGADVVNLFYVDADGKPGTQMLFRSDEARLELAQTGLAWAFDAPGAEFKLDLETYPTLRSCSCSS